MFAYWSPLEVNWVGDEPPRVCPYFRTTPSTSDARCARNCTIWVAHVHPERPLDSGAWIDDCEACAMKLRAAVRTQPETHFVIKSGVQRQVVTIQEVVDVLDAARGIESLVEPEDYLREVFVARSWMPFSATP